MPLSSSTSCTPPQTLGSCLDFGNTGSCSSGSQNSERGRLPMASLPSIANAVRRQESSTSTSTATSQPARAESLPIHDESSTFALTVHPLQIKSPIPGTLHPWRGLYYYTSCEQRWEDLEDELFIVLHGRLDHLDMLRDLYDKHGIQQSSLLFSIAYLSTHGQRQRCESTYYEQLFAVATFLSVGRTRRDQKLAVLQTLLRMSISPFAASWQDQEDEMDAILDFILTTHRSNRNFDFLNHDDQDYILLWELRAMSQCLLDREQARLALVTKTADTAAIAISAGAILVGEGMTRSGSVISDHIEKAAKQAKTHIKANESPLIMDRDAVVALTYADAAKRASIHAKESTRLVMDRIREASRCGFQWASHMLEESLAAECIPPEGREALRAAGKVGLAIVGAGSIVGEALVDTSRSVMEKATMVGADIVHHKYGASAGKVASDTGEIAVNLMRTIGNISTLSEGTTLAQNVAKDTAKQQSMLEAERAKDALKQFEAQAVSFLKMSMNNGDRVIAGGQFSSHIPRSSPLTQPQQATSLYVPATASAVSSLGKSTSNGNIPDLIQSHSLDSYSDSIDTSTGFVSY